MRQNIVSKEGQSRRTFLSGVLTGVGGVAALLSFSGNAQAARKTPTVPATGPILYRRTPEVERYYRTLYL